MNHQDNKAGAMILAAGLGTRMKPLTLQAPKPLVTVARRPLIAYSIDNLVAANINQVVVNVHYFADQVESWAERQNRVNVMVSDERDHLLDTGGGVAKALSLLNESEFAVLNSDSFWRDRASSSLGQMREQFDLNKMDFLLLLAEARFSVGYDGPGDFFLNSDGTVTRRGNEVSAPYIFAGCYVSCGSAFANVPSGAFSTNLLWDRSIARKRVFGYVLDGLWFHVGTPEAIGLAEARLEKGQNP